MSIPTNTTKNILTFVKAVPTRTILQVISYTSTKIETRLP